MLNISVLVRQRVCVNIVLQLCGKGRAQEEVEILRHLSSIFAARKEVQQCIFFLLYGWESKPLFESRSRTIYFLHFWANL
ncbi:hypothetical protein LINPERPRIM_LOCUS802, partial [Linum perenne]